MMNNGGTVLLSPISPNSRVETKVKMLSSSQNGFLLGILLWNGTVDGRG